MWAGISVLVTIWTTSDTLQKRKHFSQEETTTTVNCIQGSRGEYLCCKWSQRKREVTTMPAKQRKSLLWCLCSMQNFLQPRAKPFGYSTSKWKFQSSWTYVPGWGVTWAFLYLLTPWHSLTNECKHWISLLLLQYRKKTTHGTDSDCFVLTFVYRDETRKRKRIPDRSWSSFDICKDLRVKMMIGE